ncbi:uncharacterized protein LOC118205424 [Stegodyphus dumicola]|uniref:uncharacterized protein LOC118191154 n=1 Tax=Stegodyphus dumicola TaxID=202533 RepID=UPI0015AE06D0|nr:uncharacterized protein LOC118191154 [Stegodyphus dumicola]XP_035233603.1 uncharacterized protein LOC118205424 [Stegodyphus dumicola]
MVESCLTEDVLKAWQRSSLFNQPEGTDLSRLTNLMKFLKSEVEGEERLKLARNGLDGVSRKEGYHDKAKRETKVTSVSTECFIQAFRRFIARRGRPSTVYSDNGTNFVGTSALLKKVDWVKVIAQETLHPITWKFIPPTAAWWGGWWERLIRTAKNLIVRVLGQAAVNYEELLTVICDVEADIKVSGTADLDALDRNKLLARQRFCQELREQFRSRFRKEYLGQLVQKHGQTDCELKVGDIVLIGCENLKRVNWPIARVQELCTSRDGRVRVVKVKTRNGILIRPVRKLYPLEVCSCTKDTII